MAGGNVTPQSFAVSVLQGLRAPVTSANVKALVGWQHAEGGNWNNSARYNPLNTTESMPGAGNTGSQGNIKVYQNWGQGVQATVRTLTNGRYGGILQALHQGNDPMAVARAIGSSPWGTSGSLVAQTIAQANGQVPPGGATVPGSQLPSSPSAMGSTGTRLVTTPGMSAADQATMQRAQIASQLLSSESGRGDPFNIGPKTGISTSNANDPLAGILGAQANPANYVQAQQSLQKVAGSTPLNQHPAAFQANLKGSGYTNPLPGATWEGTDQGVDASMRNGAPILALGDSQVTNIHTFYKGQPIITMRLLNGPDAGRFWYVSEAINSPLRVGQTVRAGQTIGTYNINGTGLELGWAGNAGGATLTQTTAPQQIAARHTAAGTTAGRSFRNFLNGLGAGAGPSHP